MTSFYEIRDKYNALLKENARILGLDLDEYLYLKRGQVKYTTEEDFFETYSTPPVPWASWVAKDLADNNGVCYLSILKRSGSEQRITRDDVFRTIYPHSEFASPIAKKFADEWIYQAKDFEPEERSGRIMFGKKTITIADVRKKLNSYIESLEDEIVGQNP